MDVTRTLLCLLVLRHSVSSLRLTGPSEHAARLGSDAQVPCSFTVDKPPVDPNHLTIYWRFLEKEILSYNKTVRTTSSRYSLSTEALMAGNANLTISNIRIPDGGMYKCSVIYGSEEKEKELRLDSEAPPQVTITGKTVVLNEKSVLRCSVTGFYPEDIDIKWFRSSEMLSNVTVEEPWRNPDKTYNVNSMAVITPAEEDRERIFSCRVRHDSLQKPLQEDFRLVYEDKSPAGIIAACSVIILIILMAGVLYWKLKLRRKDNGVLIVRDIEGPPKLIDGEEATLYYTVDNCPENLCVTWMMIRAGRVQEIQTSQMREHSEEDESLLDASYVIRSKQEGHQYLSSLSFIPHMERHKDVTFICRGVYKKHSDEKMFHCKTIHVKPKLSQPIIKSLMDTGEVKYLLNLEKFFPKNIRIIWTCGVERPEEVLSPTESVSDNPDRTYNVSSEVRIPEERHKDPGFRVRVTWEHGSMGEAESRELSIRDPDYRWTPVVEKIQIPRLLHDTPAILQCNISEYFPDAVTVRWMRRAGDEIYEETENQRITSRRAADNTYNCTSSLIITPTLKTHQGAEYICVVEHPTLEEPIEKTTGSLRVTAEPQMSAPIQISMAESSRLHFSLNLQKFYPKDIKISWYFENTYGKYNLSPKETLRSQKDLTHDVTSVVWISNHSFNDPKVKIHVVWKHENMETPETRSLSIRDLPWTPRVGSIRVPELEDGKPATLTCDISGYFPDLLSVTWFIKKDGNLTALPIEPKKKDKNYKTSHKEKRQKDKTYSREASLTFTPLIRSDEGSEILCRVEHPSLEPPIETSTGPLHIGAKKKRFGISFTPGVDSATQRCKTMKEKFSSKTNNDEIETGQEATDIIEEDDKTNEDRGAEVQEDTENLTPEEDNGS